MSQLILHPCDSYWQGDIKTVEDKLIALQFIQNKKIKDHALVGDTFLNLLTFMGCAPNIQIDFDEDLPNIAYCSVKVPCSVDPLLLVSDNIRPPKCPTCKKGVNHWQKHLDNSPFKCQHCQTAIQLDCLNWKHQAGFSKTMIIINNIYPQEAQPTHLFLTKLGELNNGTWDYFYKF